MFLKYIIYLFLAVFIAAHGDMLGSSGASERQGSKNQSKMWEDQQRRRVRMKLVKILIVKIFMNLDTALRKPWGRKKPHHLFKDE